MAHLLRYKNKTLEAKTQRIRYWFICIMYAKRTHGRTFQIKMKHQAYLLSNERRSRERTMKELWSILPRRRGDLNMVERRAVGAMIVWRDKELGVIWKCSKWWHEGRKNHRLFMCFDIRRSWMKHWRTKCRITYWAQYAWEWASFECESPLKISLNNKVIKDNWHVSGNWLGFLNHFRFWKPSIPIPSTLQYVKQTTPYTSASNVFDWIRLLATGRDGIVGLCQGGMQLVYHKNAVKGSKSNKGIVKERREPEWTRSSLPSARDQ